MHGNVGNTHIHSPTHSFTTHTPLNLSICLSLSIYLHLSLLLSLSLWTPGVLLGFHPCSILFSINTIFTHSSIGFDAASHTYCSGNKLCASVCAAALCASCVVWMKQINSFELYVHCLSNYEHLHYSTVFGQKRNSFKHPEMNADAVIICLPDLVYS